MHFFKSNCLLLIVIILLSGLAYNQFQINEKLNMTISELNKITQLIPSKPPSASKEFNIPINNSIVIGNKNAKVTITKWSDFQCPYCASSASLVKEIRDRYPNDVKIVFKNFPLAFHLQAKEAGKYALAANKQGEFEPFYYELSARFRELKSNPNIYKEIAQKLSLNYNQLKRDVSNPKFEKQIEAEMKQLTDTGMRLAVPKFLINGVEQKTRDLDDWINAIDRELNKS
tara:strand:+ start:220 stop:906 length:687 start_codon:yes stop_codon:yes gene_type:complete